jgi:hypothetical protein
LFDVGTLIEVDFLALDALGPTNLVQALPKENYKRENRLVVCGVGL